jgi:predicted Zn-dependent protease
VCNEPVTGQREFTLMSEAQEIAMGRESDAQIKAEMGVYDAQTLQQYVSRGGPQLAELSARSNVPWQPQHGARIKIVVES